MLRRITVLALVTLSLASAACGDDPAVDPGVTRDQRVSPGAFQMRLVLEALDANAPDDVTCAGANARECVAEHAGHARIVLEATDGTVRSGPPCLRKTPTRPQRRCTMWGPGGSLRP